MSEPVGYEDLEDEALETACGLIVPGLDTITTEVARIVEMPRSAARLHLRSLEDDIRKCDALRLAPGELSWMMMLNERDRRILRGARIARRAKNGSRPS